VADALGYDVEAALVDPDDHQRSRRTGVSVIDHDSNLSSGQQLQDL